MNQESLPINIFDPVIFLGTFETIQAIYTKIYEDLKNSY